MSGRVDQVAEFESSGPAPVLVVCEHASNRFPEPFGTLGLDPALQDSHIAWDPGALALARDLAGRFEGGLIHATVSRLIFDLNRPPEAADAMPEVSEVHEIPGNRGLTVKDRLARVVAIHDPWHLALAEAVDRVNPVAMVTVHSFTPVYRGIPRETEIGILHDSDSRLADAVLARAGQAGFDWHRNRPYGPEDGVTHTLRTVAQPRGILPVMIEVRNDLLTSPADIAAIGAALHGVLAPALASLAGVPEALGGKARA